MDHEPKERKPSFAHYSWKLVLGAAVFMGLALWSQVGTPTKWEEVALCFAVAAGWFFIGYLCAPGR